MRCPTFCQSYETIKTFIFYMVSASTSCIYIELCNIIHSVIGGLSTLRDFCCMTCYFCSLKFSVIEIVCCPFFHKSLPNCTIGENYIWICLRTEQLSGTEQTDSDRVFSVGIVHHESIFLLPQLPPRQAGVLRWHSPASESSTLPECQHRPLFDKRKCQMPLSNGAGTLTNYQSHCRLKFEFVITLLRLGAPPVLSPRPLLKLGWKLLHQKSSQSLILLPGVDAIQLKA